MDETSHEPEKPIRFIRNHLGRIVIGVILIGLVHGLMSVVLPYQREKRIAQKIEALGGKVESDHYGLDWISQAGQRRLPFLDRITKVYLNRTAATSELISELRVLHRLKSLDLSHTSISDTGLEQLKALPQLEYLHLGATQVSDSRIKHLRVLKKLRYPLLMETQISDVGLKELRGMTSLIYLSLRKTNVTNAGLEHVQDLTEVDPVFRTTGIDGKTALER